MPIPTTQIAIKIAPLPITPFNRWGKRICSRKISAITPPPKPKLTALPSPTSKRTATCPNARPIQIITTPETSGGKKRRRNFSIREAPISISANPPTRMPPHMAAAPICAATGARVAVRVADGPWMIGRRFPIVVCSNVAIPIANKQKLISSACAVRPIPMAAATASGSTKGEMSTRVCCQP